MSLDGLPALNRRLNAIGKGTSLLRSIQLQTVANAKARVARKTGHTAQTIGPGVLTKFYTEVHAGGAAVFLEYDTKPHIIRAKPGKVLAWPATAGGRRLSGRGTAAARRGSLGLGGSGGIQLVGTSRVNGKRTAGGKHSGTYRYAKFVKHPGTTAQPFLVPAAKDALAGAGFKNIVVKQWNDAA